MEYITNILIHSGLTIVSILAFALFLVLVVYPACRRFAIRNGHVNSVFVRKVSQLREWTLIFAGVLAGLALLGAATSPSVAPMNTTYDVEREARGIRAQQQGARSYEKIDTERAKSYMPEGHLSDEEFDNLTNYTEPMSKTAQGANSE